MDAGQTNYVGRLNERVQKYGGSVKFDLVQTAGPAHSKTFTVKVIMNDKTYPEAVGRTKKDARQNAAKNALSVLEEDELVNTETNVSSTASVTPLTQPNYTCWLNEHSQRNKLNFVPKERSTINSGSNIQISTYACNYVCDDEEFPEATGSNKKEAKEAAAKLVYDCLSEQNKEQFLDENSNEEENADSSDLSTSLQSLELSSTADTENTPASNNFIGILNNHCQQNKLVWDFKLVDRSGPAHDPEFAYRVIIGNTKYPEAQGKTAKEAKQKAAQLACRELQGSDLRSQISSPSLMSESPDDVSMSQKTSRSQSMSESVIFSESPCPVPEPVVKPKIKIAANFNFSPETGKKQSDVNALKKTKPSAKNPALSDQTTKSRFLEEFDSITKIGKGGFGHVFKARRKLEDTNFAVKIVKFTKKARREVKTLSNLVHANIVRYHTSWTEETVYKDETSETSSNSSFDSGKEFLYIQMELCEGQTLREWIEERNNNCEKYPQRRQDAAAIIKQVLEAVKYVHAQKLFHRDLKPPNIMFGHNGEVKVGDFGLATEQKEEDDRILLEHTTKVGTRSYMSPELREQQDYNRTVDIYAIGLIYFELLWRMETKMEKDKLWGDIRIKKFPERFSKMFDFESKIIEKMLCENPERRPEARELLKTLEQHLVSAPSKHKAHKENKTY